MARHHCNAAAGGKETEGAQGALNCANCTTRVRVFSGSGAGLLHEWIVGEVINSKHLLFLLIYRPLSCIIVY